MYKLNRLTRYEITRELIQQASPELIYDLITKSGFESDEKVMDIEAKRQEILDYLDEMRQAWVDYGYVDLTDRQYIKIIN